MIAKSSCRICGQRGHWKAECPRNPANQGVAQTGHDQQDEIYHAVPAEATALMCDTLPDGPGIWTHDAEVCLFAGDEVSKSKTFRGFSFRAGIRWQITTCLQKAALSIKPSTTHKPSSDKMFCTMPCSPPREGLAVDSSRVSEIPERSTDQACSAVTASDRVEAIWDTVPVDVSWEIRSSSDSSPSFPRASVPKFEV